MKPTNEVNRRDAEHLQRIQGELQQLVATVLSGRTGRPPGRGTIPDLTTIPEEDLAEIAEGIHDLRGDGRIRGLFKWLDGDATAGFLGALAEAVDAVLHLRELEAKLARIHQHANGHEVGVGPEHHRDGPTVWWAFCSCTTSNVGQADSRAEAMQVAGAHAADHDGAWQPESHFHHPSQWNEDGTRR